ncbi:hypothetical protein GGI35DRAFT_485943 [Trichoderma velutinum]
MMNKVIIGALSLVAGVAATPVELVEKSSCRDDNLYKCFASREYSQSATAYCSALDPTIRTVTAAVPIETTTVLVTSTAAAVTDFISSTTTIYTATVPSATEIATETDDATEIATAVKTDFETITETETETATQTAIETAIETAIQTATQTITATVTVTSGQESPSPPVTFIQTKAPARRDGSPQPPKCMITKCFMYSPERITAACDCINVPPETITITQPGASSTVTALSNGVATNTAIVTNIMTNTITDVVINTVADTVTNTITNTITNTVTNTVASTVTITATTTTTVTVTPTPTQATNLIPNGDFSSGLAGWNTFQSFPQSWSNIGVSSAGSPSGLFALHASYLANNVPLAISSGSFGLQAQSVYGYSFKVLTTSTDTTWMKNINILSTDFSQATGSSGQYYTRTGRFSTPITSTPDVIRQLGTCLLQVALPATVDRPATWLMADSIIQYNGPITF